MLPSTNHLRLRPLLPLAPPALSSHPDMTTERLGGIKGIKSAEPVIEVDPFEPPAAVAMAASVALSLPTLGHYSSICGLSFVV